MKSGRKILASNENEKTIHKNMWAEASTVPRWKLLAMSAYIENSKRCQMNYKVCISRLQKYNKPNSKPVEEK